MPLNWVTLWEFRPSLVSVSTVNVVFKQIYINRETFPKNTFSRYHFLLIYRGTRCALKFHKHSVRICCNECPLQPNLIAWFNHIWLIGQANILYHWPMWWPYVFALKLISNDIEKTVTLNNRERLCQGLLAKLEHRKAKRQKEEINKYNTS